MSDADWTPGRELRSVAASSDLKTLLVDVSNESMDSQVTDVSQ